MVWRDANNLLHLYVWGEEDFCGRLPLTARTFSRRVRATCGHPKRACPAVCSAYSANGRNLGSAIVWGSVPLPKGDVEPLETVPGVLCAFDALDLTRDLEQRAKRGARSCGNVREILSAGRGQWQGIPGDVQRWLTAAESAGGLRVNSQQMNTYNPDGFRLVCASCRV